jgi:hypothetical protein
MLDVSIETWPSPIAVSSRFSNSWEGDPPGGKGCPGEPVYDTRIIEKLKE